MTLDLAAVLEAGAFTGRPVKREIEWFSGGETHTAHVFVRSLSYADTVADIKAANDDEDLIGASRIARCICDSEGNPVFEVSDVTGVYDNGDPVMWLNPKTNDDEPRGGMCNSLVIALLDAIGQVNDLGKSNPETTG